MFKSYKSTMSIAELATVEATTNLVFSVQRGDEGRQYYEFQEFMKLSEGSNRNQSVTLHYLNEDACLVTGQHSPIGDGLCFVLMHKKSLVEYPVDNFMAIQRYAQQCARLDENALKDLCTSVVELCEAAQDLWIEPDFLKKLPSNFHMWTDEPKIYMKIFTDTYIDEYRMRSIMRRNGLLG